MNNYKIFLLLPVFKSFKFCQNIILFYLFSFIIFRFKFIIVKEISFSYSKFFYFISSFKVFESTTADLPARAADEVASGPDCSKIA